MARPARIGIIRARHDTNVPYVSDQACLEMFFHDRRRQAVFDYWESVTRGHLDFVDSALMPWVDITLAAGETARDVVARRAYDALAARSGGTVPGQFDGWIVLTLPGTGLDAGTGGAVGGKPVCTVGVMTGNHTFYCHELGHVLGFEHTYGLVNNGIDWDGIAPWDEGTVYGDPYDLMSSASFGTRNLDPAKPRWTARPAFSSTVPTGWPNTGGMASMGPAPSPAHLHQWDPASLGDGVRLVPFPAPGVTVRATLRSAGLGGRGTALLGLTPPGEDAQGTGRVYVEYRGRHGWDVGLDSAGPDLARQAVVVHVRRPAPGDGVRTWYAGRVLVPLEADTDVAPDGTGLVVRVTRVDPEGTHVDVAVTSGVAPHEVEVTSEVREAELAFTNPEPRRTPCGDAVTWGTHILQTTTILQAASRGYGAAGAPPAVSPAVSWTVGGVAVPGPGDLADLTVSTPDGDFTVQYLLDAANPSELVLVGRGGERYDVPVTVTVTEPGGGQPRTATTRFAPVGWREGYSEEDAAALARCLSRHLDEVRIKPRDWLLPFGRRHPGWGRLDPELVQRVNGSRLEHLAERVQDIDPAVAEGLRELARLQRPTG